MSEYEKSVLFSGRRLSSHRGGSMRKRRRRMMKPLRIWFAVQVAPYKWEQALTVAVSGWHKEPQ